jgi:hypothetical protein
MPVMAYSPLGGPGAKLLSGLDREPRRGIGDGLARAAATDRRGGGGRR